MHVDLHHINTTRLTECDNAICILTNVSWLSLQVPTFCDGDVVVNESTAICLYLEENYSSDANRLMPPGPCRERTDIIQLVMEANNLQSNVIAEVVYYQWGTKPEDRSEDVLNEKFKRPRSSWVTGTRYRNRHAYVY